jgi:hypothetical protein
MPIYMKVVSLNKMDNFHEGRFLSVQVNFGERGTRQKFRQTAMDTRGEGGLTKSLTMGWPHKCVY